MLIFVVKILHCIINRLTKLNLNIVIQLESHQIEISLKVIVGPIDILGLTKALVYDKTCSKLGPSEFPICVRSSE